VAGACCDINCHSTFFFSSSFLPLLVLCSIKAGLWQCLWTCLYQVHSLLASAVLCRLVRLFVQNIINRVLVFGDIFNLFSLLYLPILQTKRMLLLATFLCNIFVRICYVSPLLPRLYFKLSWSNSFYVFICNSSFKKVIYSFKLSQSLRICVVFLVIRVVNIFLNFIH